MFNRTLGGPSTKLGRVRHGKDTTRPVVLAFCLRMGMIKRLEGGERGERHDDRPLSASGWAVIGIVCAVWFLTLGARHLLPSDEGRYAEIAREMVATGDWVTIRYQGLKYFE